MELHKMDTESQVFFYEQDFYCLSNFSSFTLMWKGVRFDTSEVAYHWEKFPEHPEIQALLIAANSSHAAFRLAQDNRDKRRFDWDDVKVAIMKDILRCKVDQHRYVKKKLLSSGNRELIEDSWRDDFWGWGPNKDGKNVLGNLWMEIREEIRNK